MGVHPALPLPAEGEGETESSHLRSMPASPSVCPSALTQLSVAESVFHVNQTEACPVAAREAMDTEEDTL